MDVGQPVRMGTKVKGRDVTCTWSKGVKELKTEGNIVAQFENGMAKYKVT